MVVPVPCTLAWSLKLLTRTLPRNRSPVVRGTTKTPYGLTSPLPGTVDAITEVLCRGPTKTGNPPALALPAEPASRPAAVTAIAASPAAYRLVGFISLPLPSGGKCLHPWARARERDGSGQAGIPP